MRNIIVFIIVIFTAVKSQYDFITRSPLLAMPLNYNIKLVPRIDINESETNTIDGIDKQIRFYSVGESGITINLIKRSAVILLHKENLEIFNSEKLFTRNGASYKLQSYTYNRVTHLLILEFEKRLFPGVYTLKTEFFSLPTDNNIEGYFRNIHVDKTGSKAWIVATNIQATGTRNLFPCLDDPELRATFKISVKHHRNFTALSNMPVQRYESGGDFYWTHFYITPPISTYHVAIVITNYKTSDRIYRQGELAYENIFYTLWCRQCTNPNHHKFARQVIKNTTSYLEFELKKVIPKLTHIAIPNIPQDGPTKWGIIFHREEDLNFDEKSDSFMRKIQIARLIAYKIANQWFSSAVSPLWWSTLWLHNGLATMFGEEAVMRTFNDPRIMDFFIVQNQYEALQLDSTVDMNPPKITNRSDISALFGFHRYKELNITKEKKNVKGILFKHVQLHSNLNVVVPILLRMIQDAVTDTFFRKGVNIFIHDLLYHSLDPSEFWVILDRINNTRYPCELESDYPAWVAHRGYPILKLWKRDSAWHKLKPGFNILSSVNTTWCIPTTTLLTNYFSIVDSTMLWITPQNPAYNTSRNPEQNWVMVDIRQAAYYRVSYETENWHMLAEYLKSPKYRDIDVINRAKVIDDAFYWMIERKLYVTVFLHLAEYLPKETEYSAWYPMLKFFEYVSNMIPFRHIPTGVFVAIKLKELLSQQLEKLGYEDKPTDNDFTKCLRQEILKWSCIVGDNKCLVMASRKLQENHRDPEKYKISPGWKKWTYCYGLQTAQINVWNYTKNMILKKHNHELLPFLTCTKAGSILKVFPDLLRIVFTSKDPVANRLSINTMNAFIERHSEHYFTGNLTQIFEKKPLKKDSTRVILTSMINHLYSGTHLENIYHFIQTNQDKFGKQLAKNFLSKIQARLSQITSQISYFNFIVP